MMHEACFYTIRDNGKVQCRLCPHKCVLNNGQWGICKVRKPENGKLYDIGYGRVSSLAIDPVEKKPLYHFYPGAEILSVGGLGCNFRCSFCQNFSISQVAEPMLKRTDQVDPQQIIKIAQERNPGAGIAFTYNEPMINYDFMLDTAKLAKKHQIPTAIVSNGYINEEPLAELLPYIDAFNIDLKGFTQTFYKQFAGAKLQPVLDVLKQISKAGKHLEITHLVVTGANDNKDDFSAMIDWIAENTGEKVPLHVSRYFPNYQYDSPATQTSLIDEYISIAREKLKYVYAGNMHSDASTYCPNCGTKVIDRSGYSVQTLALSGKKCVNCNYELPIIL